MAPSAIDQSAAAAPPDTKTYPPAKIFPVKETRFEKYIEPETGGRSKALQQPDSAAIVIDNGRSWTQKRAHRRGAHQLIILSF